tara:strand:- start:4833 stop:5108 length:276 start_codon:yes stop_codon:yes gene_type:complete
LESIPSTNLKSKVRKIDYVLCTIVVSYLCKKTNEPQYSTVKIEDVSPSLFNTRNLINFIKNTDKYQVVNIEYDLEKINFTDFDDEVCNTLH